MSMDPYGRRYPINLSDENMSSEHDEGNNPEDEKFAEEDVLHLCVLTTRFGSFRFFVTKDELMDMLDGEAPMGVYGVKMNDQDEWSPDDATFSRFSSKLLNNSILTYEAEPSYKVEEAIVGGVMTEVFVPLKQKK